MLSLKGPLSRKYRISLLKAGAFIKKPSSGKCIISLLKAGAFIKSNIVLEMYDHLAKGRCFHKMINVWEQYISSSQKAGAFIKRTIVWELSACYNVL